jgi:hypothetical protein
VKGVGAFLMLIGAGIALSILEDVFTDRFIDFVILVASCGVSFLGYKIYGRHDYIE